MVYPNLFLYLEYKQNRSLIATILKMRLRIKQLIPLVIVKQLETGVVTRQTRKNGKILIEVPAPETIAFRFN